MEADELNLKLDFNSLTKKSTLYDKVPYISMNI